MANTALAQLQFVTKVPPYNVGEIAGYPVNEKGELGLIPSKLLETKRAIRLPGTVTVDDKNLAIEEQSNPSGKPKR